MKNRVGRQSNFELLKVVSILMVLTLHYFNGYMGGGLDNTQSGTFNHYAMYYIESLSIVAVNCFVLVTGYFMIDKKSVKLRKAVNLFAITVTYGILFYALVVAFTDEVLSLRGLAYAIVPLYGPKWFVGSYIILFLLIPFINLSLRQLSKDQHQQLLIILIISFSVIPTILPNISYNDSGYGLLSFILLYCIAAYIRLHFVSSKSKLFYLVVYISTTTLTFGTSLILGASSFAWNYNALFNVLGAVSLFLLFYKFDFKSKAINYLATFTFPIYIIHTDDSLTTLLYRDLLNANHFWNSPWFLLHMIISIVMLFLICMSIDIVRRYFWKKIQSKFDSSFIDHIIIGETI